MAIGSAHGSNSLNYWVRNSDPGTLGTLTVGLHSGDPGSTGTSSEFASAGGHTYARGTLANGGTMASPYSVTTGPPITLTATASGSVAWTDCPAGAISSVTLWAGTTFVMAGSLATASTPGAGNSFSLLTLSLALS
jgi:hypothetical protein